MDPILMNSRNMPMDDDDLMTGYGVTSKIREEINSPEYLALAENNTPDAGMQGQEKVGPGKPPRKPVSRQREYSMPTGDFLETLTTPESMPSQEAQAMEQEYQASGGETKGLEEPQIDPVSAFVGGFSAPAKIGITQGAKLFPTLIRALTSGTTGAIMDYPIGMATEKVQEAVPGAALPFSVLTGMVSGATIENAIEQSVMGFLQGRGVQGTPDLVRRVVEAYKGSRWADETGAIGKPPISKDPVLVRSRPVNDIIYLEFDAKGGRIPDAAEIKQYIVDSGFSGTVIQFSQESGLGKVRGTVRYRVDVTDKEGRASSSAAKELSEKFGGSFQSEPQRVRDAKYGAEPEELKQILSGVGVIDNPKALMVEVDLSVKQAARDELAALPTKTPEQQAALDVLDDLIPTSKRMEDVRDLTGDTQKPIVWETKEVGVKAEGFLNLRTEDLPTERAININFNRIDSEDGIKDVIARTSVMFTDEIQDARRGTITNRETQALANLIGLTPEKLLQRRKGQAFSAEEALASRQVLIASSRRLMDLASVVAGRVPVGDTPYKDLTVQELQFAFEKQLSLHSAIQEQVSGMTAEAGRALQSFRIQAKEYSGRLTQIDDLMKRMSSRKIGTDQLASMVSTIDTAEGLSRFARDARKATGMDMFLEAWVNALLSGPTTHAVNSVSNVLTGFLQIPERALGAGISKLFGDQAISFNEPTAQVYGIFAGFKDALRMAGKTLVTGEGSGQFSKVDLPQRRAISAKNFGLEETNVVGRAVDLIGEGVRLPTRFLQVEDDFFKGVGYRMELQAQAARMASRENLKGDAFSKRVAEIVADPPDNIRLAAIDQTTYQTFTKDLGDTGRAGMRFLSKAPALRLIIPFVQTPTNIIKFFGERTPAAFGGLVPGVNRLPGFRAIAEEIQAGGARRDMALSKMSLGSMVMGVTGVFAASGHITGGGPKDTELRNIMRQELGWQPYSIKIDGKYYAYNRLEPLGMIMGIAADATEIMGQSDDLDATEIALASVMAVSKNITSKTFLKGLSSAVEALEDPERYGQQFIAGYLRTVVPTGVAQIERQIDPTIRSTYSDEGAFEELLNSIKDRVPGYSDDLPPKREVLTGRPIVPEGALGPDILSPAAVSTERVSAIGKEIVRMKTIVRAPATTQSIMGVSVRLTPKEYDQFQVLATRSPLPATGKPLRESLNELVKSPTYKGVNDERKEIMIKDYLRQAREQAKMELFNRSPELQVHIREMQADELTMMGQ